jgi:hypothetical protein
MDIEKKNKNKSLPQWADEACDSKGEYAHLYYLSTIRSMSIKPVWINVHYVLLEIKDLRRKPPYKPYDSANLYTM